MFPRIAAKGPVALLGLLTVLLPGAVAGPARTAQRRAPASVTLRTNTRQVQAARTVQGPALRRSTPARPAPVVGLPPAAPRTGAGTGPTVRKPAAVKAPAVESLAARINATGGRYRYKQFAKRTHGGGVFDVNLDYQKDQVEDPRKRYSDEIEPWFLPGFFTYVLSTSRGAIERDLLTAHDFYPAGPGEPQFLVGPDFHINISTGIDRNPLNLQVDTSGKDRGEQFEPTTTQPAGTTTASEQRLAFSAFMVPDHDAYVMAGDFDNPGMPTRVIRVSDDVLKGGNVTIGATLKAEAYTSYTDNNGATTPVFTTDASPEFYPVDHNQIVFSSLRGYNKDDASTHYAKIYVWTPAALAADQPGPQLLIGQNFNVPGPDGKPVYPFKNKSLLFPRFSPDGRYLSFTVTDARYDPVDDFGNLPDIVWDIDYTKKALNTPKNPIFIKSARIWMTEPKNAGGLRMPDPLREPEYLQPIPVTTFKDNAGNEPRDIMSFWSPQGQLGFSSDRVDTDGDGLADSVNTDLASAKFDVYTFPFPFSRTLPENQELKDISPHRQTLGPNPSVDDSNELKASWGPINPLSTGADVLEPTIIYQADDRQFTDPNTSAPYRTWDIWLTDKSQTASYTASLLQGVPVITGDPDLSPQQKENLKRTHRVAFPNDYVTIAVQVNPNQLTTDGEGNVNTKVFADVKDPDNYKWEELISSVEQSIGTYIYHEYGFAPVMFGAEDVGAYQNKFMGQPNPPKIGSRIQLDYDPARGPGWFSAKWYTPLGASDFLVDIRVTKPDETSFQADNVAGFSTAPFVVTAKTLLVSDFTAGQKVISEVSQTSTTAGEQTESYLTARPHSNIAWNGQDVGPAISTNGNGEWNTLGPLMEFQEAQLVKDPISGKTNVVPNIVNDTNPLTSEYGPWNNFYNLWRVQCREPITVDDVKDNQGNVTQYGVLKDYLPTTEAQPGLPTTPLIPRTQTVVDKCVLWFAPHAGQLNGNAGENSRQGYIDNKGTGTVARLETQGEIVKFLNGGGRMLLSGDDVANIVSASGSVKPNPALLAAFKVKFHSHYALDVITVLNHPRDRSVLIHSQPNGQGTNPIPYATWEIHPNGTEPEPSGESGAELWLAGFNDGQGWHPSHADFMADDGAWTNEYIDAVSVDSTLAGVMPLFNFTNPGETPIESLPEAGTPLAAVQYMAPYAPAAQNTSPHKTAFFAVGLEGLHRKYDGKRADGAFHAHNPLAQIVHNTIDFMTTGGFVGKVTLTNNVTPVKDVLVWVVDGWNAVATGNIMGTGKTDESGRYEINGLDSSNYQLYVYKTGYAGQNPDYRHIDSGWFDPTVLPGQTYVPLLIYPVSPGTLKGSVVDKDNNTVKIAGVPVHVTDIQLTVDRTVTSDANGNYQFDNLPAGLYTITTPEYTDPNTSAAYAPFATPAPVTVNPGPNVTTYDIGLSKRTVPPSPATLIVTTMDGSTDPASPANGATITVIDSATGQNAVTLDGGPNPCSTVVTGDPATDGICTFKIKAGVYTVKADYTNFKTQSKTVTVQPDNAEPPTNATKITFTFGGVLHVFTGGKVLLASAPYDYAGTQASPLTFSSVLHLTTQQLANSIVAYDALGAKFAFFPNYPADTFHLGRGYGFKLPADGRVTEQGNVASASGGPYVVRAEAGWNLIGNPFTSPVVWNSGDSTGVQVTLRDDPTQKRYTVAEALANGWLTSPLWGGSSTDENGNAVYAGYAQTNVLQPWQAFWVKAAQPLLFYVPQAASTAAQSMASAAAAESLRTPLMPPVGAWAMNITASAMGLTDDGLAIGLDRNATNGQDAGMDLAKPGMMSSGNAYLYTAFVSPSGAMSATDVRPVGAQAWTFKVYTNLNMRDIALTWKRTGGLPAGGTLTLVDTATGSRVNMMATDRYTFRSARSGGIRALRVEYRPAGTR